MKTVTRETKETKVTVSLAFGPGPTTVSTGAPFFDHMLSTLTRFARMSGSIQAAGDLRHHIIEDVAIVCGRAVAQLCPEGAARFADRTIPMDDALVHVALDFGSRGFYRGRLPSALYEHWMRSFADSAGCTLHVRVLRGRDVHHIIEAAFKGLGITLREALRAETDAPLSLKGIPVIYE